jgi:hypothetical protein
MRRFLKGEPRARLDASSNFGHNMQKDEITWSFSTGWRVLDMISLKI